MNRTVLVWHQPVVNGRIPTLLAATRKQSTQRSELDQQRRPACWSAQSGDDDSGAACDQRALESGNIKLDCISFRSMGWTEASMRKASALRLRHAQSLTGPRHRQRLRTTRRAVEDDPGDQASAFEKMRYFFDHLDGDTVHVDEDGLDLVDVSAAGDEAAKGLADLAWRHAGGSRTTASRNRSEGRKRPRAVGQAENRIESLHARITGNDLLIGTRL
jgi:hypothetical protein